MDQEIPGTTSLQHRVAGKSPCPRTFLPPGTPAHLTLQLHTWLPACLNLGLWVMVFQRTKTWLAKTRGTLFSDQTNTTKHLQKGFYPLVIVQKAIENDHRNSGYFPIEHGGSFHSYVNVYQRVTAIYYNKICWWHVWKIPEHASLPRKVSNDMGPFTGPSQGKLTKNIIPVPPLGYIREPRRLYPPVN